MNELFVDGAKCPVPSDRVPSEDTARVSADAGKMPATPEAGKMPAVPGTEPVVVYDDPSLARAAWGTGGDVGELRERVENLKVRAVQACDWFEGCKFPPASLAARMLRELREAAEKVG